MGPLVLEIWNIYPNQRVFKLRGPCTEVNGMKKVLLLPILLLFVFAPVVQAQSLDIPIKGYGISFGNSKNFTGLRFNWADSGVEQINGLNLTFGFSFKALEGPREAPSGISLNYERGEYNGISFGLIATVAKELNGLHIGGLGLISKRTNGFIGGMVVGSDELNGLAVSGMYMGKTIKGVSVSFAGTIADEAYGISLNGFGHRFKKAKGLFISFMAGVIDEELTGISVGAIFDPDFKNDPAGPNKITGLVVAADPRGKELNGVMIGALGVDGYEINGLALGGIAVKPRKFNAGDDLNILNINGIALGGLYVVADQLNGVSIGGLFNRIDKVNGISIGLVNYAKELNGIQIGLVNYVGNNPDGLKILPGINAHFSF
jgi:hypothetical protein